VATLVPAVGVAGVVVFEGAVVVAGALAFGVVVVTFDSVDVTFGTTVVTGSVVVT
jgi:hypothetical protein